MAIYDVYGNPVSGGGGSLSSLFDVTEYGAKGNGTADDTTAIQAALNDCDAAGGGTVYFPVGAYKITGTLLCYSNQTIDLNGSTILQGGEINSLLMGYVTSTTTAYNGPHDIVVQNGTFDGGSYEVNNTLVGFDHGKNITIRSCKFVNAYGAWHDVELCACSNCVIEDCDFEGARKNNKQGEMLQIDAHGSAGTWPWSNTGAVDGTPCKYIEVKGCIFHDGTIAPGIGNHTSDTSQADMYVRVHDCVFSDIAGDRAAVTMQTSKSMDVYNNTFINCTGGVGACLFSAYPTTVHDNRFENVTTPFPTYASAYITAYNNMIDGTLTNS